MKLYVANAFSLSMLPTYEQLYEAGLPEPQLHRITKKGAISMIADASSAVTCYDEGWESVVGHADTALLFSHLLGVAIDHNRKAIRMAPGDVILVGQLMSEDGGPVRLPEGCTTLPEGITIEWWSVD